MPIMDYDLYIFDWDGTLSTSTSLVRASTFMKNRYNVDYIKKHPDEFNIKKRKSTRKPWLSRTYSYIYDVYAKLSQPRLQPGALETIDKLRAMHKKIAIFSDSNSYRLMAEARTLGIIGKVDLIVSSDAINYYKPNPEGLLIIIDRFKARKSKSIYIGDMASDILTARFANIASCCVGNGVHAAEFLKKVGPDYLYRNLVDMGKALKK